MTKFEIHYENDGGVWDCVIVNGCELEKIDSHKVKVDGVVIEMPYAIEEIVTGGKND